MDRPSACRLKWYSSFHCNSSLELHYYAGFMNAIHDVLIPCLPQRIIWNLHLVARKRLAVGISFIGFVASLMGISKIAYIQGDKPDSCRLINPKPPPKCFLTQSPRNPIFISPCPTGQFPSALNLGPESQQLKGPRDQQQQEQLAVSPSEGTLTDAITELAKPSAEVAYLPRTDVLLTLLSLLVFVCGQGEGDTPRAERRKKRRQNKTVGISGRKGYPVNNVESKFQCYRGWPTVTATPMDWVRFHATYDTAWVAMMRKLADGSPSEWLIPSSLNHLPTTQSSDGG
ncbi:hypothetical protein F9C07_2198922 [Aspergillus flavus]|uniref:Rhodopsin domain-containing protein n=1 Tax=Aspergillus flavus (strain ATCC 200026 / FGSC A1120 / IAM 13836 / NRRL 3357 / JCM 12722 / SRRC 167) TaxID=332952 RepID=A0A7U2QSH8_ASPFN|nr:hypothetical protein F9C07_2198922 [Aspergillus flavus]